MTNIRKCRKCGKEVDFDEPWCVHETMEESAWLNMLNAPQATNEHSDIEISEMAEELGKRAAYTLHYYHANFYDSSGSGDKCSCDICKKVREEKYE